jgi:hypothetical protein
MNKSIVFAATMRGRHDDKAKSALHVDAVLALPTMRVAACSWKPVRQSCARPAGQRALGHPDRLATVACTGLLGGSLPDIPLRQERLKNKQRRPRSRLRHKQPFSRRRRRAARVRRRSARRFRMHRVKNPELRPGRKSRFRKRKNARRSLGRSTATR